MEVDVLSGVGCLLSALTCEFLAFIQYVCVACFVMKQPKTMFVCLTYTKKFKQTGFSATMKIDEKVIICVQYAIIEGILIYN